MGASSPDALVELARVELLPWPAEWCAAGRQRRRGSSAARAAALWGCCKEPREAQGELPGALGRRRTLQSPAD
eukprot:4752132-Alexandrium_andersonii.AAC.1